MKEEMTDGGSINRRTGYQLLDRKNVINKEKKGVTDWYGLKRDIPNEEWDLMKSMGWGNTIPEEYIQGVKRIVTGKIKGKPIKTLFEVAEPDEEEEEDYSFTLESDSDDD